MTEAENPLPQLILPKRFERLKEEAIKAGIEPQTVVERVSTASERIETLLRKVQDSGTGQFEVFFGSSGSGKTTFLSSLPKFFEGVTVRSLAKSEANLADVPQIIRDEARQAEPGKSRLYFFSDRDNAKIADAEAESFFEELRILFRENEGQIVLVWPVTRKETAEQLPRIAWDIGADSMVPIDTRGLYNFVGLDSSRFVSVADVTVRSLRGDGLESYGVSQARAEELARGADTIGYFYSSVEQEASEVRGKAWSVLRKRIRPHVWIVVVGDDGRYLDSTVKGLVQGRLSRVDVELVLDFLDDASNDSAYLQKWRERRREAAFLLRSLDVRVLPLHSNVALAAIRTYGDEAVRSPLRKSTEGTGNALTRMKSSALYKAIISELTGHNLLYTAGRPPSTETEDEFNRIQRQAKASDKGLNKAVAEAISEALVEDGINVRIVSEKRDLLGSLQPDIQVWKSEDEVICIEPTWRTSGKGIVTISDNQEEIVEIAKSQNSMTPGNIQKYLLDKILEYVTVLTL